MTIQSPTDTNPYTRPAGSDRRIPYPFTPIPKSIPALIREGKLIPTDAAVVGVLLGFRLAFNDSCWCSKATIAKALSRTVRTVQYSLERLEKAGVIRRVKVDQPDPDEPRNRTGWRIYFLFLTSRTTFGSGPDRRSRNDRKRPVDPCSYAPEGEQFFASPPGPEGEQSVAPPSGATDCFESQTEAELDSKTTTTACGSARTAESSSSFASLPDEDRERESPHGAEVSPLVPAPEIPAAGDPPGAAIAAAELPAGVAYVDVLLAACVALLVRISARFKQCQAADGKPCPWSPEKARHTILNWITSLKCPYWWVWLALKIAEARPNAKRGRDPADRPEYVRSTLANWLAGDGTPHESDQPSLGELKRFLQPAPAPVPQQSRRRDGPAPDDQAREATLRAAWEELPESDREAIRAAVKAENPRVQWANMLEPLYLAALEAKQRE